MDRVIKQFKGLHFSWVMVMLVVMLGGTNGCTTLKTSQAEGGRDRILWESREQYVAIEQQDHPAGMTVPANAHPADVSADRLREALENVEVRFPGKEDDVPLFKDPELGILCDRIREGLLSASPGQDVTFAIIGHYPALLGLMQERKVTTGRVFCANGQVNIIFGDLLRDVKENEDRRLHPLRSASRAAAAPENLVIASKLDGENFTMKRSDWLAFPLTSPALPAVSPVTEHQAGNKAATPAASPAGPATAAAKRIEERLTILNDLWHKKLVTDDEYRVKRREILNDL